MRQKNVIWLIVASAIVVCGVVGLRAAFSQEEKKGEEENVVKLPKPKEKGKMSLEEAIKKRRCVRKYKDKALELSQLSQLLWSANGITGNKKHLRAAPSAGGLHPLDFYAVVGKDSVTGLDEGVWHYNHEKHTIKLVAKGDKRQALQNASIRQSQVGSAEVVICVTIEYKRTTWKYGDRGKKYAHMDVGFACENLFLQVQTLDLAACVVGAFSDSEVTKVLSLPKKHEPVLLLTIGYPE